MLNCENTRKRNLHAHSTRANIIGLNQQALYLLRVILFSFVTGTVHSQEASVTTFDVETLKHRGLNPMLAQYFKDKPRFRSGPQVIFLTVNGAKKGRVSANFENDGSLCFDETLLDKAGLYVPNSKYWKPQEDKPKKNVCYDLAAAYPQISLDLKPNRQEVSLIVPQEAVRSKAIDSTDYSSGGTAAIINYDVTGIRSKSRFESKDYVSTSTQLGFNIGNWIVRSQQMYIRDENQTRFEHLYTYAQRTFPTFKSVFQAGQINIFSPIFSGSPILGLQTLPETALLNSASTGAGVQGIASSQATVEVRQYGTLIYSTIVPEGPFSLKNVPILNSNADLDVTVRERDGSERHFVVSASTFRTATLAKSGYSFALGKIRSVGATNAINPWVTTGAGSWSITDQIVTTAGLMASSDYQAAGLGFDTRIISDTILSLRNIYSNAKLRTYNQPNSSLSYEKKKAYSIALQSMLSLMTI